MAAAEYFWLRKAKEHGITGHVVIEKVHVQRGWDQNDHLIDESAADALKGRECKHVLEAVKVAQTATGRFSAACTITLRHRSSRRRFTVDTSANFGIPGRRVPALVEIESD